MKISLPGNLRRRAEERAHRLGFPSLSEYVCSVIRCDLPSAEDERQRAATTGFAAETLEKVVRLGTVAADVGRHPLRSRVLVLKGGTALNLCFGPPRRLSVDLDVNYVGAVERAAMLAERPEVERAVRAIAAAQGYRVQESKPEHAGGKLHLRYTSNAGTPDRIEVDLNVLMRVPLSPSTRRSLWQPEGGDQPPVAIASLEELVVGKLCALRARAVSRDLFDALQLPTLLGDDWHGRRPLIAAAGERWAPLT